MARFTAISLPPALGRSAAATRAMSTEEGRRAWAVLGAAAGSGGRASRIFPREGHGLPGGQSFLWGGSGIQFTPAIFSSPYGKEVRTVADCNGGRCHCSQFRREHELRFYPIRLATDCRRSPALRRVSSFQKMRPLLQSAKLAGCVSEE